MTSPLPPLSLIFELAEEGRPFRDRYYAERDHELKKLDVELIAACAELESLWDKYKSPRLMGRLSDPNGPLRFSKDFLRMRELEKRVTQIAEELVNKDVEVLPTEEDRRKGKEAVEKYKKEVYRQG